MANAAIPYTKLSRIEEELRYPSSDGKPLAETDIHVAEIIALWQLLTDLYRDRDDVYVASNNFVYYKDRSGKDARISPDVYVVMGVEKGQRRVFKVWQEDKVPNVIFEVSSRGTSKDDQVKKKKAYSYLGVREYFLYDPENDYLRPPLQGFRLVSGKYQPIQPDADGFMFCEELQLKFRLDAYYRLRVFHMSTGVEVLRYFEARRTAEEQAQLERERANAEKALAKAAVERVNAEKALAKAALERANKEKDRANKEKDRANAAQENADAETLARKVVEDENARLREQIARLTRGEPPK